jgi:hypothetical protein
MSDEDGFDKKGYNFCMGYVFVEEEGKGRVREDRICMGVFGPTEAMYRVF